MYCALPYLCAAVSVWIETQSYDGTGNNLAHPTWGAAGSHYLRLTPPAYADSSSGPNGASLPGARFISNTVMSRGQADTLYDMDAGAASEFMPSWGVMLHLDVTLGCRNASEPFPIPVPTGDRVFDPFATGTVTIPFTRTCYDSTDSLTGERFMPNGFTSYIDCSGLYGNSPSANAAIRTFVGGKLKSRIDLVAGELPLFNPAQDRFVFGHTGVNIIPVNILVFPLPFRTGELQLDRKCSI
ncbi:hypothetical protein SeMB42_g06233 [Synchytrium endobioticum]|uniref:Uncharacterized protein n=1 Tax=Synchytrium endobioticum TaxID=286115 RepID=A0A507CE91_9FUNG|nr:hypothetical protein SeMB42_g06233 [Synchytrium endobioticum]